MEHPSLLSADAVLAGLHWRYATKKFDPAKEIDPADWAKLEAALVLSASSWGFQPYKFVVVTDPALRAQLKAAAFAQPQVSDCSHLVVFAARTDVSEADIEHYVERVSEVRGVSLEHLEGFKKMLVGDLVNGPRHAIIKEWSARQAYIALGNLLTVAALTGVDACPMEGFAPDQFNEILGLGKLGYTAVVIATLGYRAADDGAANVPKVRFPAEELVVRR